jgi:hypothetical protein
MGRNKSVKMKQITEKECNQYRILRQRSPVEYMGYSKPTEERAWYAHNNLLGIVLFDKVDSDWSFVALYNDCGLFRAYDVGASFHAAEAAEEALREALETGPQSL